VVGEIDLMAHLGMIDNEVADPGVRGRQSTFRATPALLDALGDPIRAVFDPRELIRLKNTDGKLIDYRETAATEHMRRQIADINDAISGANITMIAPKTTRKAQIICCGKHTLYLAQRKYYRVFNGTWKRGGRFYGPWWQSARAEDRAYIVIKGEPTIELDYPEHHLRMAYALVGVVPPDDPYVIDGW
jgi:hypothetical protein